jgi:uncharacterized Zn-finger protein
MRIKCNYPGCSRSYCSQFNLKRHVESFHMGHRKFKCSICGKFLSSKQNYIDHQNIHTGARPYSCSYPGCNTQFRQLSQFYLHKQLHQEVSDHLTESYKTQNNILSFLAQKLSEEAKPTYTIPLYPYTISDSHLPLLNLSQGLFS